MGIFMVNDDGSHEKLACMQCLLNHRVPICSYKHANNANREKGLLISIAKAGRPSRNGTNGPPEVETWSMKPNSPYTPGPDDSIFLYRSALQACGTIPYPKSKGDTRTNREIRQHVAEFARQALATSLAPSSPAPSPPTTWNNAQESLFQSQPTSLATPAQPDHSTAGGFQNSYDLTTEGGDQTFLIPAPQPEMNFDNMYPTQVTGLGYPPANFSQGVQDPTLSAPWQPDQPANGPYFTAFTQQHVEAPSNDTFGMPNELPHPSHAGLSAETIRGIQSLQFLTEGIDPSLFETLPTTNGQGDSTPIDDTQEPSLEDFDYGAFLNFDAMEV